MEAKDWLPIFFERSNATGTLWNIEIVVVLGLVAFVGSGGVRLDHFPIKLAITLGFLVAAAFNLFALAQVTQQREILAGLIRQLNQPAIMNDFRKSYGLINPIYVPPVSLVVWSHLVVDAVVCLFIWLYPRSAHTRK